MVDVCVVTNIFRCNADLFESPHTQEEVFGESVTSAGSMYTLSTLRKKFPDEQGRQVYSEMHTADWWWEQQVRISSTGLQRHAQSCLRCADSNSDRTRQQKYRDTHNLDVRHHPSYQFLQR